MSLAEIQSAIEALPAEQQAALLDWLADRDRRQWDTELERDFSAGGAGMNLLEQVKERVRRSESLPMDEGRR
jgi:hypothetical protein